MTSSSKTTFMGQNLRRLPRSELDDSIMRDLTRHDARLTENLRTVDRARDVVLKSLESDKKNFIRGGINGNKKVVKSTIRSPNDSRQASATALQQQRYFPDMRTRRAYEQMITSRRPSAEIINSYKPVRSKTDLSDVRKGSKKTVDAGPEDDLNNNDMYRPNSANNDYTTGRDDNRSKSRTMPNNSSPSDLGPGPRASTTPTIKIDDYDTVSAVSPHREDDTKIDTKTEVSDMVNGKDRNASPTGGRCSSTPEGGKRQGNASNPPSTMPLPFSDDFYFGRRPTFWEYMSTPKNLNLNRQKREQLEQEFAARSQEKAATPRSAKGQRIVPPGRVATMPKTFATQTTPRVKSSSTKRTGLVGQTTAKSTIVSKGRLTVNK